MFKNSTHFETSLPLRKTAPKLRGFGKDSSDFVSLKL
jgi:hypothetical protein